MPGPDRALALLLFLAGIVLRAGSVALLVAALLYAVGWAVQVHATVDEQGFAYQCWPAPVGQGQQVCLYVSGTGVDLDLEPLQPLPPYVRGA
jgi:hypothetical protein